MDNNWCLQVGQQAVCPCSWVVGRCLYEGIGCALVMQSIDLDSPEILQGFRHWFGCDISSIRFAAFESRRLCFLRMSAGSVNPHEWGCLMRLSTRLPESFHIKIVVPYEVTAYCPYSCGQLQMGQFFIWELFAWEDRTPNFRVFKYFFL